MKKSSIFIYEKTIKENELNISQYYMIMEYTVFGNTINKLILSETVYVILLNIVIIIDYIIWHMGIKPHNIIIDDHLNLKNYFYLYDLEEEYINNYYKVIYKNLKLKLIIEKNQ